VKNLESPLVEHMTSPPQKSVYDSAPAVEDDLWFLPGPAEDGVAPGEATPPWPSADQRNLIDPSEWRAAEATHAVGLARAAAALGALDERLRNGPEGPRQRLALLEIAELSWQAGDRVPADRLALYNALRLSGAQDDSLALARAGWAFRRLTGGPGPESDLDAFLGRPPHDGTHDSANETVEWAALLHGLPDLHTLSNAALAYHAGRIVTSSSAISGRDMMEAAVVAARIGAHGTRGGLIFVPLALGGVMALQARGPVRDRLSGWYTGLERGALAALMHLDRLAEWTERVTVATAHLSGRTPPRLVQVLAEWPLVSAAMAEAQTNASRAAVQRNLAWMQNEGLVREVTGQGRYRFWTAAI
jgi:hypothetical protein